MAIISVILAGGVGTRLWPLSRTYYPKQFLEQDGPSLFQETFRRAALLSRPDEIYIVTNEIHQYLVRNQVEQMGFSIPDNRILKEPVGKNTLPAISWAMHEITKNHGPCTVGIFPSDHFLDDSAMTEIAGAIPLAKDYLVTFGISPAYPNTGYGYISLGKPVGPGFVVREFKEKPDEATAAEYVSRGYLWNSGMFLFSSGVFFSELRKYQSEFSDPFSAADFDRLPAISVDYGLLEKSDRVAVVPIAARWTDLGTFKAWYDIKPHDAGGNVGNAEFIDSHNNIVIAGRKKTALIGIHDLVVVDTGDALLLCDKEQTERVNTLVKKLKEEKSPLADFHLEVHRPWGSYVDLERSGPYRIKRVTVKPGEKLSLQFHHHRSEHWVVVSGMADVELDGKVVKLRQGESTFVPAGITHSLGNSGWIPLEVIEVQIGEYLEEDDITRLRDNYNRA